MKKKLTYGPRDVDDISWALFCVPHRMALYPSPAPSVLPCARRPPHRALLPPFWSCGCCCTSLSLSLLSSCGGCPHQIPCHWCLSPDPHCCCCCCCLSPRSLSVSVSSCDIVFVIVAHLLFIVVPSPSSPCQLLVAVAWVWVCCLGAVSW